MKSYSTLLKKDLWIIKNFILELKENPKRLIVYIFYVAWFGLMIFNSLNSINNQSISSFESDLRPQIMGAGFIVVIFCLLIFSLYKSTKESSTFFSMGDVHFLFPSPVSSRKVLLYSMIKYSILHILFYVFVTIAFVPAISNFVNLDIKYIPFMYLGFIAGVIVIEPLSFLLFSVGTKYKAQTFIKRIVYALLTAFGVYFVFVVINQGQLLEGALNALNAQFINYIPIIGWSKVVFMTPVEGFSNYTIVAIILQGLLLVSCILLAYHTADDYYEDVLGVTEKKALRKKNKQSGKAQLPRLFIKKDKEIKIKGKMNGHMALLWKSKVEKHRTDLHVYFSFFTIILIVISAIVGYFIILGDLGSSVVYILNAVIAYIIFIFSASTAAGHELSKPFIYLIPGSPLRKLIAVHMVDIIRMTINAIVLNVIVGVIAKVSIINIIVLSTFVVTFYILNLASNFLVRSIFPNKADQKVLVLFFMLVQFIFIILPSGAVGMISYIIFRNWLSFFLGVVIMNIVEMTIMMFLSNVIFRNIEWV